MRTLGIIIFREIYLLMMHITNIHSFGINLYMDFPFIVWNVGKYVWSSSISLGVSGNWFKDPCFIGSTSSGSGSSSGIAKWFKDPAQFSFCLLLLRRRKTSHPNSKLKICEYFLLFISIYMEVLLFFLKPHCSQKSSPKEQIQTHKNKLKFWVSNKYETFQSCLQEFVYCKNKHFLFL